jgi:hypothetical protein
MGGISHPGNYRFIPAVFRYSSGAAANPDQKIERMRFDPACCSRIGLRKSCPRSSTAGEERAEHRTVHIAELGKRASEADAKLKRLYNAIEHGVTDVSDLMLKDRITELKAIRD